MPDFKGEELIARVFHLVDQYKPLHLSIVGGDPLVRYRELQVLLPQTTAGVFRCGGKEIADCQRTFHFEDSKASLLSSVAGCVGVGFWSRCGGPPSRALMDSAMRFVFASAFSTLTFTI